MTYLIIGLLALLATGAALRALRGKWDLLAEHSRDLTRHAIAAILMLGTMAGTFFTFSAGKLRLSGIYETIVSVGGIAIALEVGVVYCGWYLGQLDQLIKTARRDERDELLKLRKSINRWFYATAAISAIANFLFRYPQLGNVFIAAFISGVPIVLVVLLLVKLRKLPTNHSEKARQATSRALYMMVAQAEKTLTGYVRMTGRGHAMTESDQQRLAFAVSILRVHASTAEAQALDYGILPQSGADEAQLYVDSAQLHHSYGIPIRTAQDWISKCPGARPRRDGRPGREAPLIQIQRAHGMQAVALPEGRSEGRSERGGRNRARSAADDAQSGVEDPQVVLADTQAVTVSTQPVTSA